MAEIFLSAVLPVLIEKLTPELLSFATREGVGSKLNKLKKKFEFIDALLVYAEQKQLTRGAVKKWLDELQDLAYDAEDILDEFATEVLRRKLKIEEHQASTSRARKLIPSCCVGFTPSAVRSKFSMQSEIDGITTRLEELCKRRSELELLEKIAGERSDVSRQRPPPTTYFPTQHVVPVIVLVMARIFNEFQTGLNQCENRKASLLVLVLIGKGKRVCLHAEQERLVIKGNSIFVKQEDLL